MAHVASLISHSLPPGNLLTTQPWQGPPVRPSGLGEAMPSPDLPASGWGVTAAQEEAKLAGTRIQGLFWRSGDPQWDLHPVSLLWGHAGTGALMGTAWGLVTALLIAT